MSKIRIRGGNGLMAAIVLALVLPAVLWGCGNGSSSSSGKTVTGGGTVEVHMKGSSFDIKDLTIDKGTTIRWINDDPFQHTVTAKDKSFDSGRMSQNQTYEHTFNESGSFDYICTIHPSMQAKVTVP